jgi:hypothetical protein
MRLFAQGVRGVRQHGERQDNRGPELHFGTPRGSVTLEVPVKLPLGRTGGSEKSHS